MQNVHIRNNISASVDFHNNAVFSLHDRPDVLLACGKHVHDRIISIRRQFWPNKSIIFPERNALGEYDTRGWIKHKLKF
jgi:hypothetical protein